jgi:putative ABC transport system permease protein
MIWFLARQNLRRGGGRTGLLVAGITVAGALLFDMSMLGGGLERSFGASLGRLGYQIRVVLAGTLPLSTEALMDGAEQVARRIAAHPEVETASAVIGTNLYVDGPAGRAAAVAYGLDPDVRGIVRLPSGEDAVRAPVVNAELARRLRVGPGDVVRLSATIDPRTGQPARFVDVRIAAVADFVFDLRAQRTIGLPGEHLRRVLGLTPGQASFVVVRVRRGASAEAVAQWIETTFPTLDAFSIERLLAQVSRQLVYFNHFAVIVSAVSLLVAILLIGAVLTLAVGERLSEIAMLRAVGLSRRRTVWMIVLEGAVLAAVSVPLAFAAGAVISQSLEAILRAAPGIPQDLRFFVFTAAAAGRTAALLLLTGMLGAVYPAWIAGRLNIAATLHQEVQS